ncbi:thiamine pyrophosphate-binding protein [Arthrobacter zhaoguopingii]|uniref:thiamine pyrophosphate-binding protein n=1 Tax=Arthrobacter zhaoguopingii TaxID=2681491 RepID=UPI003CCDB312
MCKGTTRSSPCAAPSLTRSPQLSQHGITSIFGQSNPTDLVIAADTIGTRQMLYRTESAAGVMAGGFLRISRRISVVAAQNGTAATLLVPHDGRSNEGVGSHARARSGGDRLGSRPKRISTPRSFGGLCGRFQMDQTTWDARPNQINAD